MPPWTNGPPHFLQRLLRIRQVRKHEPCMSKIELLAFIIDDIGESKLQVCKLLLLGFTARQFEFDFINVGSNNPAARTDYAGKVEGQAAASAANLEAIHSAPDPCLIQKA
jgi:hypothetical protein